MIRFISRNWKTAILLLLVGGMILLGLSGYMSSVLKVTLSPVIGVERWLSTRYIAIVELLTVPKDVVTLQQKNTNLESQVSRLQTQVIQLQEQLREAQALYALLDFARLRPDNIYVAAAVIGRDPSPFLHYIIIDHGSDDGIRHGMPVVTEQGLVGRVDAVIAGAARVQLITDPSSSVNVRIQSSQKEAMLDGSLTGDVSLDMIPQDVTIQAGDLVLTSGFGGNYPADVLIGQVTSIRKYETDLFQTASVQPAVDFANIRAVLIITNFKPVNISPLVATPQP
jgi:rod shape-determining protein MreC